jgi:hypothetical protein
MDALLFNAHGYKTTHGRCIKPQTQTSYTTIDGAYVYGLFAVPRTLHTDEMWKTLLTLCS